MIDHVMAQAKSPSTAMDAMSATPAKSVDATAPTPSPELIRTPSLQPKKLFVKSEQKELSLAQRRKELLQQLEQLEQLEQTEEIVFVE